MPDIKPIPVEETHPTIEFANVFRVQWTMATGDTAVPAKLARFADRAIQIGGTFSGATVKVEGSLDGVTWSTLRDGEGLDLTAITDARIKYIQEPTAFLRPVVSGGDVNTALTITLMATRGGGL